MTATAAARVPRVLLVEDNPADVDLIAEYFAGHADDGRCSLDRVDRVGRAVERLASDRWDAVLLDLSLPDATGLEGLVALSDAAPDVPVVVLTGCADGDLARAAVLAGAHDYLVKGEDGARTVRRAVSHAIERHKHRRERDALLARERDARRAAERSARARDEVLGIVSHDLRGPLATMVSAARAIDDGIGDDPGAMARAIVRSGEWALRIIRDLLDVTVIEAGRLTVRPEPTTAVAVVAAAVPLVRCAADAAGVTLDVDHVRARRRITVDVDRVAQALGNLLGNAVKFTPRGGRVTLAVSVHGDRVHFRVQDTGPGIAPEHLPHLFDRFWQARATRRGGAGLGLAIAKGIAEGHGGRIDVDSTPGAGSAFTLVLPIAPQEGGPC